MRIFLSVTAVVCIISFGLVAQDKGDKGKAKAPPKNLKILTPETYRPLMDVFIAALGLPAAPMGCTHCHVGPGQMFLDDNPKKDVARMMIAMTREINAKFPDGKQHVTCYTCHRGAVTPLTEAPK
jgi:photosynthetic reaction center cytochrome c subunit